MNPVKEEQQQQQKIIHENFGESKSCCFFKLILSPTSQSKKLRIPDKFARTFRKELSTTSIFTVPTGETHKVAIVEEDNKLWFQNGWQEFVEYFSIGYAFFILFKYDENSNFRVHIFDPTACEISYQCNVRNAFKPRHEPCAEESDEDSDDDKDSIKILPSSPVDLKISDSEVIQLDSDDEETDDAKEGTIIEHNRFLHYCGTKFSLIAGYRYPYRMVKSDGIMNVVAAAGISLPERPFFIAEIKTFSLCGGAFLNVPLPFVQDHIRCMQKESKFIKLEADGGRQFTVKCMRNRCKGTFGTGWIIFARAVGLEVGDICVFEVTDAKNSVLNVLVAKKSQIKAASDTSFEA